MVKDGQLLVTFDKEAIEKEGYSTEIPMIITNFEEFLYVGELDHEHHVHEELIMKILG